MAENGGELIRARTSEGRERAKARGVKLGRRAKLTEHQKREAICCGGSRRRPEVLTTATSEQPSLA